MEFVAYGEILRLAYILVFSISGILAFVSLLKLTEIQQYHLRLSIQSVFISVGIWSVVEALRLIVMSSSIVSMLYIISLIAGAATLFSWLYFSSVYTQKSYYQDPKILLSGGGIFLLLASSIATNPIHSFYYTVISKSDPFMHISIKYSAFYWILTGCIYLTGLVSIYPVYKQVKRYTSPTLFLRILFFLSPVAVLVSLIAPMYSDLVLNMKYIPLGVGLLAATLIYDESIPQTIHERGRFNLIDNLDDAFILVNEDNDVIDYNDAAMNTFPLLEDSELPVDIHKSIPEVSEKILKKQNIIYNTTTESYYSVTYSDVDSQLGHSGTGLIINDITELKRNQKKLEIQDKQLDDFAEALTHEIRNTVNIMTGHLDMIENSSFIEDMNNEKSKAHLNSAQNAARRLERVTDDLATLASNREVINTDVYDIDDIILHANEKYNGELDITCEGNTKIICSKDHVTEIFRKIFLFAELNGADELFIEFKSGKIILEDNGSQLPKSCLGKVFEHGHATPNAELGSILPVVNTLSTIHGWEITIDPEYKEGVRYVISSVEHPSE